MAVSNGGVPFPDRTVYDSGSRNPIQDQPRPGEVHSEGAVPPAPDDYRTQQQLLLSPPFEQRLVANVEVDLSVVTQSRE